MTTEGCHRIGVADLVDYTAGEMGSVEVTALEEHLFACAACAARAADVDALVRAIGPAVRTASVGGLVTDAVLNRLSREGVRMRTYALSPGAIVHCAVWDGDELMALRLRADLGEATEVTLSQRIDGQEVLRTTGPIAAGDGGEIIHLLPAASVRGLPVVEVEVVLTVPNGDEARQVASYTLVHGGSLHR
jgi:hypothetical protein